MSCFITLEQDLKELKYYDDIKKIFEISNKILKNGIEHLYEEKVLEVTLENVEQLKLNFNLTKVKEDYRFTQLSFSMKNLTQRDWYTSIHTTKNLKRTV